MMEEEILVTPPGQTTNIRITHQHSNSDVYLVWQSPNRLPTTESVRILLSLQHPDLPSDSALAVTRLNKDPPHFLMAAPVIINALERTSGARDTQSSLDISMEEMSRGMEQRIRAGMSQELEKSLQTGLGSLKADFDDKLETFKTDFDAKLSANNAKHEKDIEAMTRSYRVELSILGDQVKELSASLGRVRRQHRASILFSAIQWLNVEIGASQAGEEGRPAHSATDHKAKHTLLHAVAQPWRYSRVRAAQSTGQGRHIITHANAMVLNTAIRVDMRNSICHIENDIAQLLSSLMDLERHCFRFGGVKGTVEGMALAFVVLVLGRDRYTRLIRNLRSRPIDFDPPDIAQLHRIRMLWRR